MSSLNKAQLIGHLGRDPESKSFQNGGKIVNLRVATSESWKDRQTGERRERTEWHQVVIQNEGLCSVAERYLRKGSKIYVEGRLQTRKWRAQNGEERYTTEIVLTGFDAKLALLDGRAPGGGEPVGSTGGRANDAHPDLDDDVPF